MAVLRALLLLVMAAVAVAAPDERLPTRPEAAAEDVLTDDGTHLRQLRRCSEIPGSCDPPPPPPYKPPPYVAPPPPPPKPTCNAGAYLYQTYKNGGYVYTW